MSVRRLHLVPWALQEFYVVWGGNSTFPDVILPFQEMEKHSEVNVLLRKGGSPFSEGVSFLR